MKFKRIKKFGYWGVYNVFGYRGEIDGVIFEAKTLKECKDFCKKAA